MEILLNLINIFGIFISNFINVSLKENNIIMLQKLNRAIKLPFTDEIEEEGLPEDLVEAARKFFEELIRNKNNREPTTLSKQFERLINEYYPKAEDFYSTKNLVKSTSEPIIGNLYNINIKKEQLGKIKDFVYLGLEIKGEDNYTKIKENISSSLKYIKDKYDLEKSEEINELINCLEQLKSSKLPKDWKYPHKAHKNLWHCTTLFKGKTKYNEIANTDEYKIICPLMHVNKIDFNSFSRDLIHYKNVTFAENIETDEFDIDIYNALKDNDTQDGNIIFNRGLGDKTVHELELAEDEKLDYTFQKIFESDQKEVAKRNK